MNDQPDKTLAFGGRNARIVAIQALLEARGQGDTAAFAASCLARVPDEDLPADDALLASAVDAFFGFGAKRELGQRLVRVFNPDEKRDGWAAPITVLEAIGKDMPFLLDSLLADLNTHDVTIRAIWHPVVHVRRDRRGKRTGSLAEGAAEGAIAESMIHVELEPINLPERRAALVAAVNRVFHDVELAVSDWQSMLGRLDEAIAELRASPPPIPAEDIDEALSFLNWIRDNHFTFLGCRDYTLKSRDGYQELEIHAESGLGVLTDPERRVVRRGADRTSLSTALQDFFNEPAPLIITKANTRSTVHRHVHMDYLGVKRFDKKGRVIGERRFVGLFTSAAYTRSPRDIPYLRRKIASALVRAGFRPGSHDGKAYLNILEHFPRDELFQVTDDELSDITIGILRLNERPRPKLFLRRDKFDRFVSAIVYLPRERYTTQIRTRIMDILVEAFNGRPSAYYPTFGDDPLARIHYIIGRTPGDPAQTDLAGLEAKITAAVRTWEDDLRDLARARYGEFDGMQTYYRCHAYFGAGYREAFGPGEALDDVAAIESMGSKTLGVRLYRADGDPPDLLRFKVYHAGDPLVLSDVLPVLEKLGLRIVEEHGYPLQITAEHALVIHDFAMREPSGRPLDFAALKQPFEEAFEAVWQGVCESDGLNRLVVRAGLSWRDVSILRTIARYLRQAAIAYSLDYMEEALGNHPAIADALVRLFYVRFDPDKDWGPTVRIDAGRAAFTEIEAALDDVASLDEDRILRRFADVIMSTLRTSFFQRDGEGASRPTLALKLDSQALLDLPAPRPMVEIFVYSRRMEGVHLRFGKVARGGLRWSDRREDFRTEILGLVKAQRVKNAVIVPVGAKGGFIPKLLPQTGAREDIQTEAVTCYRMFVAALLDLTDNFDGAEILSPERTIRYDTDDPYLVVAADKGTATFSDIANGIALERGFWLGDAFASGGSQGYDHKKMGITARGAWEAVKRHFRERGVDIQTTPITVVGIGDMSGDVFGNGMLLSDQIRLVAAFDHRDIFIDPDPDPATSFVERKRLFELPRSSWADYDPSLISVGGGVFSRKRKAIAVSPQIRALTGLSAAKVPPNDLIRALLKADVDLLWFGGIGTYVKAKHESHLEVGDRANDGVRIDAGEVHAKVIGEGANLGCTQAGRVEFARAGGRINTDAVDNAAGVDTSDHEVNIKILLDAAVSEGALDPLQRSMLLSGMSEAVAELVLAGIYRQTLALTLCEATAAKDLVAHGRFMDELERGRILNRVVERLPDREALRELETRRLGLTRPEIAVLIAYAKITLFEDLLASDVPDDPQFAKDLSAYFPGTIQTHFNTVIGRHRLRREIISTVLANRVVNLAGPTFIHQIRDEADRPLTDVARAFVIVCASYGLVSLYDSINALDNKISTDIQTRLHLEIGRLLRRQTLWFLRNGPRPLVIDSTTGAFQPGIEALCENGAALFTGFQRGRLQDRKAEYCSGGVPEGLAQRIAGFESLGAAADIVAVAQSTMRPVDEVGRAFFTLGEALGLDQFYAQADAMAIDSHWEALARQRLVDQIVAHQRVAVSAALDGEPGASGEAAAMSWIGRREHAAERVSQIIGEFTQGGLSIAKLAVAETQIRDLSELAG